MDDPIAIQLSDEQRQALDRLARTLHRDRATLISAAIDAYLDTYDWHRDAIARGIADADAGDFASTAEVEAVFARFSDRS